MNPDILIALGLKLSPHDLRTMTREQIDAVFVGLAKLFQASTTPEAPSPQRRGRNNKFHPGDGQ